MDFLSKAVNTSDWNKDDKRKHCFEFDDGFFCIFPVRSNMPIHWLDRTVNLSQILCCFDKDEMDSPSSKWRYDIQLLWN